MDVDMNFQVWLDMQNSGRKTIVIPYVRSPRDTRVNFRFDVIQSGAGGTSRISQSGRVSTTAAKPEALARVELGAQTDQQCRVEVALREGEKEIGAYKFDCSPGN